MPLPAAYGPGAPAAYTPWPDDEVLHKPAAADSPQLARLPHASPSEVVSPARRRYPWLPSADPMVYSGHRERACWTPGWIGTMADLEQSAEQLFGEALELQPERRAAFLDQACRGAPELRRLVEGLLCENQLAGSFLAEPLLSPDGRANLSATQSAVSRQLAAGTKLGRYVIVERRLRW